MRQVIPGGAQPECLRMRWPSRGWNAREGMGRGERATREKFNFLASRRRLERWARLRIEVAHAFAVNLRSSRFDGHSAVLPGPAPGDRFGTRVERECPLASD